MKRTLSNLRLILLGIGLGFLLRFALGAPESSDVLKREFTDALQVETESPPEFHFDIENPFKDGS